MRKQVLLCVLFLSFFHLVKAQPGNVDSSFGINGIVNADFGVNYNYPAGAAKKVLLHPDGSMYFIIVDSTQTRIAKRLSNGNIDSSYGQLGLSEVVNMQGTSAAQQTDGKVVVVGYRFAGDFGDANRDFVVARFNSDGTLDPTFGKGGVQTTNFWDETSSTSGVEDYANAVAIQADGKIVVAGSTTGENFEKELAIARYRTNGDLDSSFSGDGKLKTTNSTSDVYANAVIIQKDSKIVAAGSLLFRFNSNGSPDNTFSGDGKQKPSFVINAAVIQSNGKIVVGGTSALARYNTNGSPDNTFSGDGKQTSSFSIAAVAIQSDGKIVVGGSSALARYNANGSLDNTFSGDGKQATTTSVASIAIQGNGKIVLGGSSLARYKSNGSVDITFNKNGSLLNFFNGKYTKWVAAKVQKDGKTVALGYSWNGTDFDFTLARYNTNGSLDNTFSGDGVQTLHQPSDNFATALALQNDGKIVVAGDSLVARYNSNGNLDKTFSGDGLLKNKFSIASVAIQADGKIVVAGKAFVKSATNGDHYSFAVARYKSDGSVDNSFSGDGIQVTDFFEEDILSVVESSANSVAIQANGKIVLAGVSGEFPAPSFARYNTDGKLDSTFDADGLAMIYLNGDGYASSIAIQGDGKIVVAANVDYRETSSAFLMRLRTNGSTDFISKQTSLFGPVDHASSIAIQPDGKIVVAGDTRTNFYGTIRNFAIARFNTDGSVDNTFAKNGIQITKVSAGDNAINGIAIANSKLYVAGFGSYPESRGVVARYLLANKPPVVSITSPVNNTVFAAPANFTINASASDPDGTIASVKFYLGSKFLQTDTKSPYAYSLSNLPAGTYTLTAKATDNLGAVTTSSPVTIKVNKAPVVSITSPLNSLTYTAPATITIKAAASDQDGTISSVKFYKGSTYLKTVSKTPYVCTLSNLAAGTYSITAKATDNNGAQTLSVPLSVSVSNAAIVSSKSLPGNGETSTKGLTGLQLNPNPATSTLNISTVGLTQNKAADISVISASGIVMTTMHLNSLPKTIQLNVSSIKSGVYSVRLTSGDKVVTKQFVKL